MLSYRTKFLMGCVMLASLVGCAANVNYVPADTALAPSSEPRRIRTLRHLVDVQLDTGYGRALLTGSQWMHMGTLPQGEVYKAHNGVFTLEGAHIHEAWLVIAGERLTGFYLPVERGFSPLKVSVPFRFSHSN